MVQIICLLFALILIVPTDAVTPPKPPREIAPYPPMHWHSWNTFCAEDMVNETNMREMADALIATGMVAAGYDTVNVVCNGWTGRDPVTKEFTENSTLWPNGIASFADYLHKKGMRLGCYTSPATKNCCGEPGSLGFEYIDMEFFARVGCDHVMVDWCHRYTNPKDMKQEYAVIGAAIKNSSNPNMLYGIWPGLCYLLHRFSDHCPFMYMNPTCYGDLFAMLLQVVAVSHGNGRVRWAAIIGGLPAIS